MKLVEVQSVIQKWTRNGNFYYSPVLWVPGGQGEPCFSPSGSAEPFQECLWMCRWTSSIPSQSNCLRHLLVSSSSLWEYVIDFQGDSKALVYPFMMKVFSFLEDPFDFTERSVGEDYSKRWEAEWWHWLFSSRLESLAGEGGGSRRHQSSEPTSWISSHGFKHHHHHFHLLYH